MLRLARRNPSPVASAPIRPSAAQYRLPRLPLASQPWAGKKTLGKPHPKAVYDRQTGEPIINEERMLKVFKWKPDQVEHMRKHMKRIRRVVNGPLSDADVQAELQSLLNQYIEGLWGTILKGRRDATKKRRRKKQKKRTLLKQQRRMRDWQEVEDFKERKVIRDREREMREDRGEQFSVRRFLQWWRSTQKQPYIIHDEVTFQQQVADYFNANYFNGPRIARRPIRGKEGYKKRFDREIWEPLAYELKRKAKLTELIEKREAAILEKRVAEELAKARAERKEQKQKLHDEKMTYFNKTLGDWHTENQRLIQYKRDYVLRRNEVMAKSRREFLEAMNDDIMLWKETPDECKFMRFAFGEGVKFPFKRNKAAYH